MSNETPAVIDRSIAQLESLACALTQEIQQPWTTALLPLPQRRLCKEALLTISVLLPKLHAVQRAHSLSLPSRTTRCRNCDD